MTTATEALIAELEAAGALVTQLPKVQNRLVLWVDWADPAGNPVRWKGEISGRGDRRTSSLASVRKQLEEAGVFKGHRLEPDCKLPEKE